MHARNITRLGEILKAARVTDDVLEQVGAIIEDEGTTGLPGNKQVKGDEFAGLFRPLISAEEAAFVPGWRQRKDWRALLVRTPGVHLIINTTGDQRTYLRDTIVSWARPYKLRVRTYAEGDDFYYGIFLPEDAPPPARGHQKHRPGWFRTPDTVRNTIATEV